MNRKALIALASVALFASAAARAESPDTASQYAAAIDGNRTRAEVMAEAATVAKTRSTEPAGSRVAEPVKSAVARDAVRAQAAEALRLGQISHGEASDRS